MSYDVRPIFNLSTDLNFFFRFLPFLVVITPRQVSPYSFTPLTAAQSPQVRTLLPPALHNYEVTVSSSAHQSTFPSSSVQMKGQARNKSHVNVARVSSVELVL